MNILAIGAHFDDAEIGCGGALLEFKNKGHGTHLVVVTDSGYTDNDGNLIRSSDVALAEGTHSAEIMGVSSFITIGLETNKARSDTDLITKLNGIMDKIEPDIIFTHWHGDLHEDHREVARASLVAARRYPNVLMYKSNWYHSNTEFSGRMYIDITSVIDDKAELIRLHETEYRRRGEEWIDFIRARARQAGLRMGMSYAEEYEVFKYKMVIP